MATIITSIIKLFSMLIKTLFRRGKGITKILFTIDDFFRIFTMTLLIPIFFSWIGFGSTVRNLGVILGLIIDIQDFISEFGKRE